MLNRDQKIELLEKHFFVATLRALYVQLPMLICLFGVYQIVITADKWIPWATSFLQGMYYFEAAAYSVAALSLVLLISFHIAEVLMKPYFYLLHHIDFVIEEKVLHA